MTKWIKGLAIGFVAFAFMLFVQASHAMAAAIDYASTTQAIDDATSGVGPMLLSGGLKVVGIALGIWGLFFLVGKLRKHTK